MIDIPSPVSGRTRPSAQGLGYLSPAAGRPSAFGAGAAAALARLGVDAQQAQAKAKTQADATQRFDMLRSLEQFQTKIAGDMVNLKRNAAPATANFFDQAEAYYANAEGEWLNSIPEEFRDEFAARTAQIGSTVLKDAIAFQFESTDAYHRTGVNAEWQKSLTVLENGGDLETETKRLSELLDATSLSDIEKGNLNRTIRVGLQAIAYRKEAEQAFTDRAEITLNPTAFALIADEEGFLEVPRYDVNHLRGGHGTDTITRADGTVAEVTAETRFTKADAERDLNRRIKEEEDQAFKELGPNWERLNANARAGLLSVAYNYGTLPNSVKNVILSGGGNEEIAQAVEGLSANTERRKREAAIIRGQLGGIPSRLDDDPRYDDLPYEDRIALRTDAQTRAAAAAAARKAASDAAAEQAVNDLMVGIHLGDKGRYDRDQWLQAQGGNVDYDDLNRIDALLDEKEKETNLFAEGMQKLGDDTAVWSPTSTDDKDMLNALFNQGGGPQFLANADQTYVTDALVPIVRRSRDIPIEAMGILEGMLRSNNSQQALFALDTLAQLQEASPDGFIGRTDEALRADVQFWLDRKGIYGAEETLNRLRGGVTTEERNATRVLREEGEKLLTQTKSIDEFDLDFESVWNAVTPSFLGQGRPGGSNIPFAQAEFSKDFQTFFVDEYERRGNASEAKAAAITRMQSIWGPSNVGGIETFMKYPPQAMGYQKLNGRYDWMNQRIREEYGMDPLEQFQLIGDNQTNIEAAAFRTGSAPLNLGVGTGVEAAAPPTGRPPSYRVARRDADGNWHMLPDRVWVEPSEQMLRLEADRFAHESLVKQFNDMLFQDAPWAPQDFKDDLNEMRERVRESDERLRGLESGTGGTF